MITPSRIMSASGAADYYTKDNFYTSSEEAEPHTSWFGKGAEELGLSGTVTKEALQAVLEGLLPDGTSLAEKGQHRPGFELAFSPPKSVSLLALVGGDKRLIELHREAVRHTLTWAEKQLAQTRIEVASTTIKVKTGNLLMALVEHDTNRNHEPDLHTHVPIANATRGPDGKWRTLHNDLLWQRMTLLSSLYNAYMRFRLPGLGYETAPHGKHGSFEIVGIPRAVIEAFSTRSKEINEAYGRLAHQTPQTKDALALKTRRHKPALVDREAVAARWQEQATRLGVDFGALVRAAETRSSPGQSLWDGMTTGRIGLADRIGAVLRFILEQIEAKSGGRHRPGNPPPEKSPDPFVPETPGDLEPGELTAAHAVASAIRHLSQREVAWDEHDLYKSALDLHLPISVADVEKRISQLQAAGLLLRGRRQHAHMLMTPDALATENRILEKLREAEGQSQAVLPAREASARLQAAAQASLGNNLNPGQEAAGRLIVSSSDRYVGVQGVAGSGKTAMLKAAAVVLKAEGHAVLGLGHQNRLVHMLERETGIDSRTIRSFIAEHRGILDGTLAPAELAARQAAFKGAFLLVDEASMISNSDKLKLMQIADALGLQRMAFVGDKKQIGAIDAGKPFEVQQAAGLPTARMNQNLRQRSQRMKTAAKAAYEGRISETVRMLQPYMREDGNPAGAAAQAWLALPPEERAQTALYASGREARAMINTVVQQGLRDEGVLKGPGLNLTVLERLPLSLEQERILQTYKPGQRIEFARRSPTAGIKAGTWGTITEVDQEKARVTFRTDSGEARRFFPQALALNRTRETLRLYEAKSLTVYRGDQIRWTTNDKERGLLNADIASITGIGSEGVLVETATRQQVLLPLNDPMLKRLDLAYALNAHMAQGLTSEKGIVVMDSRERYLSNQRLFLVTITRTRDDPLLFVDSVEKLSRRLMDNTGDKTSSLEVLGKLATDAPGSLQAIGQPPPTPLAPPGRNQADRTALLARQAPSPAPGLEGGLKRDPNIEI